MNRVRFHALYVDITRLCHITMVWQERSGYMSNSSTNHAQFSSLYSQCFGNNVCCEYFFCTNQKKVTFTGPVFNCFVSDFRHTSLSVHEPNERTNQAKRWLTQNLPACTLEKIVLISNNRSAWLGTSDSSYFMNLIDSAIEYKVGGNPEVLARMYGSTGVEGTARAQSMDAAQAQPAQPAQPDAAPEKRAP